QTEMAEISSSPRCTAASTSGSIRRANRFRSSSTYHSHTWVSRSSTRSASLLIVPAFERVPRLFERSDDVAEGSDGAFHASEQAPAVNADRDQPRHGHTPLGDDVFASTLLELIHEGQAASLELTGGDLMTRRGRSLCLRLVEHRLLANFASRSRCVGWFYDHGNVTMVL